MLVVKLAILQQRSPQHPLTDRADLEQGSIAAAVVHHRPRFETTNAERGEDELEDEIGRCRKQPTSPERRADGEPEGHCPRL